MKHDSWPARFIPIPARFPERAKGTCARPWDRPRAVVGGMAESLHLEVDLDAQVNGCGFTVEDRGFVFPLRHGLGVTAGTGAAKVGSPPVIPPICPPGTPPGTPFIPAEKASSSGATSLEAAGMALGTKAGAVSAAGLKVLGVTRATRATAAGGGGGAAIGGIGATNRVVSRCFISSPCEK